MVSAPKIDARKLPATTELYDNEKMMPNGKVKPMNLSINTFHEERLKISPVVKISAIVWAPGMYSSTESILRGKKSKRWFIKIKEKQKNKNREISQSMNRRRQQALVIK
jgi:hypothetical protein